jgi:hypothetical protein
MQNLTALLVALMFITILTLGIAGILAELAEVVRCASSERFGQEGAFAKRRFMVLA